MEQVPSYLEILTLPEDEFKKWILYRSQEPGRTKLIEEMINHEEETRNIHKDLESRGREISKGTRFVLSLFEKEKSIEARKLLEQLCYLSESKEDLVLEAILAKSATDYFLEKK